MQTEEITGSNGDASPAVAINAGTAGRGDYMFDAPELTADIPWGEGVRLRVSYSKPEDRQHEDYEAAVVRKQIIDESGTTDETDPEAANCTYFDDLVLGANKFRAGQHEPFETWDKNKCLSLPPETKSTIVARMGQSDFNVVGEDSDEALFDPDTPMEVRQIMGKEAAPDHEIVYTVKPLSKAQRADYESGMKSKDKTKKRRTIRTSESHLFRKGKKLFAANFIGVTGGSLASGPYTPEKRDDFLKQIDGSFQMLVIDTMNSYYKRGRE